MKIWIARHGQTRLNLEKRMQGLTNEPLNETGIRQAEAAAKRIGHVDFDAVYASPLDRAVVTGSIIGNVSREKIRIDQRLIEVDFGRYEKKKFLFMGPLMSAYWAFPEVFPRPRTVESIDSMKKRSVSFLQELEQMDYDNVLVACHGGIMRALTGYLDDRRNGLWWRPKPRNCEIRVFESIDGKHQFLRSYTEDDPE
ncbi:MAG: histidine phosphatase family protein [Firmicutes bacterium]|nr:histidine phosphatase family protein [Bacillota bacterium]